MKALLFLVLSCLYVLSSSYECPGNTLMKCYTDIMQAISSCTKSMELLQGQMVDNSNCIVRHLNNQELCFPCLCKHTQGKGWNISTC